MAAAKKTAPKRRKKAAAPAAPKKRRKKAAAPAAPKKRRKKAAAKKAAPKRRKKAAATAAPKKRRHKKAAAKYFITCKKPPAIWSGVFYLIHRIFSKFILNARKDFCQNYLIIFT